MDAGSLIGLLGQITSWLDDFRHSDTFSAADIPLVGNVVDQILQLSDVVHDTLLIDDHDNDNAADDTPKLLNADNTPTFTTAQEFAIKVATIFGLPINGPDGTADTGDEVVHYNSTDQTITFTLDLSQDFGTVDLPINFDFDLGPLLDVGSNSSVHLHADGGLSLTFGLYLGSEGGVTLANDTPLSSLKDGIVISNDLTIAGQNDVRTVFGQLSADAKFSLSVNGGPITDVIVHKSDTDANQTVDDLIADLTAAIATAHLDTQVGVAKDGNKVVLMGLGGVTSIALSAVNGNPAVTQIGFRPSMTSENVSGVQKIKAAAEVTGFVGRLSADAVINVVTNANAPVAVTITTANAEANRNILDIVADVQRAFDHAGFQNKITVSSSGKRLILTATDDTITSFSITAPGTAASELGLPTSASGTSADLRITTRDGAVHNISLDDTNGGTHTLGDVIAAIQSGTGGRVSVSFTDNNTRLRLTDHSSGGSLFKIENAFGS